MQLTGSYPKFILEFRVFAVFGSNVIRPNQDYQFSVTSQGLKQALTADFKLSGRDTTGANVALTLNKQTIAPGTSQMFTFGVSLTK